MLVILILTLSLIAYGIWEFHLHQRNLLAIPIRIHVNGTRGKSSVARLIAAALRAGGYRTFAKTTGTLPRIIDDKGLEVPILRPTYMPNIIEQVKIIRYMRRRKPEAIVIECMAVQPEYQWICEHRMVKSTIGVITNARPDHLREMGPTLENVTRSLMNTYPTEGHVFTAEQKMLPMMKAEANKRGIEIHAVSRDMISPEAMLNFNHLEYRENVALALAIARHLDIPEDKAMAGMHKSYPDAGALRMYSVREEDKEIRFINALAANDPESTLATWQKVRRVYTEATTVIILLNTRADRFDRSVQLLEMISGRVKYDYIISIGEKTSMLGQYYRSYNINKSKVVEMGLTTTDAVYHKVVELTENRSLVLAVGNMGAGGLAVAQYFREKGKTKES